VLICIDGSGPDDDAAYDRAFAHSFLRQMCASTTQANYRWYRGPNSWGRHQESLDRIDTEAKRLYDLESAGDADMRVFLAGYSRGAAGVVQVASELWDRYGIEVDALFLFDAVDRSDLISSADVVPRSVHATYHARRDPLGESRESFGNTATSAEVPETYQQRYFLTTHGGMGGTLWGHTGLEHGWRRSLGDEYSAHTTTEARRAWIRHHGLIVEYDELGGGAEVLGAAAVAGVASDAYTTLTMAQEEAGALACIQWMWPHMVRQGAVVGASVPRVHPNRGHFGRERF
jgi:hypothetical protein